jgi:phosphoenolpyruvate synthase/pyruvate phosphate dikinase
VTYPEILRMQVRAIVEAMIECKKKKVEAKPEIMIPLVGSAKELKLLRGYVQERLPRSPKSMARLREARHHDRHDDRECPAPPCADEIAEVADFFSFGTNDLTQLTFGFSRDDVELIPARLHRPGHPARTTRSSRSTRPASASWSRWACVKGRDTNPGHQARHLR